MKRENEIKISELEKNCSGLVNEKEDLVIKLIQAESDVKSLSSSLENQKETVCELENVISDLKSKKTRVPNVAFSQGTQTDTSTILSCLPRTYDRAFLIQRKPFGIMKPQCLPSEIARKVPMGMNSSKVTPPRRQIKLFDIKPSERVVDTSNAWKPKRATPTAPTVTSATDVLLSTVRGILNKMTPSKHEQFLAKILALEINDEEKLSGVIQLFFEKALDEPMYAATYAQMCQSLSTKQVVSSTDPTESLSFRTLLLSRCQKVFQKDSDILIDVDNKRKEVQKAETKEKKTILETELISLIDRNRRTTLGNIKFIGELYKVGNITENVMHNCIRRLLQAPDEEAIESLCRLLTTAGKNLDSQKNSGIMNSYFQALDSITKQNNISNRIRFLVQDVCDLRKRNWLPRNEPSNTNKVENRKTTSADEPVPSLSANVTIVSVSDDVKVETLRKVPKKDVGSESPLASKNSECQLEKLESQIPATLAIKQRAITRNETCGFEPDKKIIKQLSKQHGPFNIPDRDQAERPVSAAKSKSLPSSSTHLIVSDQKNEKFGRSAASKPKNKQTTPAIAPQTEVTQIVTTFLASGSTSAQRDSTNTFPTGIVAEKQVIKQQTEKPSSAASSDFVILSSVTQEINYDEIVVSGIPNSDCGRVIGRGGANIKRLQEEYGVKLSFFEDNLYITDGDAEGRRAACSDVIDNLLVSIECRNLDLTNKVYSSYYFKQLNFQNNVRISRPSQEKKFLTIWGTLERCRKVYQILLQAGSR
jgi:translation initiation factor 4G